MPITTGSCPHLSTQSSSVQTERKMTAMWDLGLIRAEDRFHFDSDRLSLRVKNFYIAPDWAGSEFELVFGFIFRLPRSWGLDRHQLPNLRIKPKVGVLSGRWEEASSNLSRFVHQSWYLSGGTDKLKRLW